MKIVNVLLMATILPSVLLIAENAAATCPEERQACNPQNTPGKTGKAYLHPIYARTDVFNAAKLAAEFAKKDPKNAARIVAETAVQIYADVDDLALIMSSVMRALDIVEAKRQAQFITDVGELDCATVPAALMNQNVEASQVVNPSGTGNVDADNPGTTSPNPESTSPGEPVSPN